MLGKPVYCWNVVSRLNRLGVFAALTVGVSLGCATYAGAQTPEQSPAPAEGQTVETAPVVSAQAPQEMLKDALQKLEAKESVLDAETRKLVPGFKAILTRYYTDKESLTQEEKKILFALRQWLGMIKTRDINLEEMDATFVTKVKQSAVLQKPPRVVVGERKVPGIADPIGIVSLVQGEQERVIAEIPNGAGGLTAKQRARKVANRLATAAAADPLWWTGASVARKKGAYVVAAATAPDGYVITADNDYAKLRGMSADKLAATLMREIRQIYGGSGTRSVERSTQTEIAVRLREQGDTVYAKGDTVQAERLYNQAVERDPAYLPAYERLVALYQQENNRVARRYTAVKALKQSGLTTQQRQLFTRMAK